MAVPTKLAELVGTRYREITAIGSGSQGQVYRALDSENGDAPIALKWVEHGSGGPSLVDEFAHLVSLNHAGLVRVLGLKEGPSGSCLISEFVAGESIATQWAQIPAAERVAYVLQVAEALAAALGYLHARGLVHGDVKPENMRCPALGPQPVILLDLGLARIMGPGDCRGTPAYMAPEALSGHIDAKSDLYSLGVALIEMITGERLFAEPTDTLFSAILAGKGEIALASLASYPPALSSLLLDMIAVDRGLRPSGMAALREHIARVAETLGVALSATEARTPNFSHTEFFGREAELATLVGLVERHARGLLEERICEVAGPEQSGRTRLVQEALLRAQVSVARAGLVAPAIRHLHLPGTWSEQGPSVASLLQQGTEGLGGRQILVIDGPEGAPLCDLLSAEIPERILLLVRRTESAMLGAHSISLGPLESRESALLAASLAVGQPDPEWLRRAGELTQHRPGRLVELMRAAAALDPDYSQRPDALFRDNALSESLVTRVSRLDSKCGSVLEMLAVLQAPVSLKMLASVLELPADELAPQVQALVAAGLVTAAPAHLQCISSKHAEVIDAHLPAARRKALHRRALQAKGLSMPLQLRARHLLVVGPTTEAAKTSLDAIEAARAGGDLEAAMHMCRSSADVMRGQNVSRHAALTAEVALMAGDYDTAEEYAAMARRSRDSVLRDRGMRSQARCAQRRGDLAGATAVFRELAECAPSSSSARAELGKSLLAQGKLPEALAQAHKALALAQSPGARFAALETAGLVHLYEGDLSASEDLFLQLGDCAAEAHNDRLRGRALGLLGMVAQKNSELSRAGELYAEAAQRSEAAGALHAGAVFRLNQATALQRGARYSQALACYESAHRGLLRGGTPFELCAAYCNRGNLLLTLGELESARKQAESARSLAERVGEPRIHFFVHLLLGELSQREHRLDVSLEHYAEALALAQQHGLSDRAYALMRLAEAHAVSGNFEAERLLTLMEADSEEHRGELVACRARVALGLSRSNAGLVDELKSQLLGLRECGDLDLAWKMAALLARSLAAIGRREEAVAATREARELFGEVERLCPEAYRGGLGRHPDAEALASQEAGLRRDTPAGNEDELPLRRLLALSRRLNSEQRIETLLDEIIDTAVELSRAERAFLLLRDSDGALQFHVARNMGRKELGSEEQLSTTIAERVATTGQIVMTVDAEADQRFGSFQSVAALQLRSILAVPFRVKERIVGTLYLDHRFRRSAFDERAVEVVCELADIAAVAIENARLTRDNRRRQEEIRELNHQLEDRLERTEVELAQTRAKVPEARPAGGFSSIIGNSAPMRALFDIAERAASCDLSVVIFGESGTGKELLARAVHNSGPRAHRAFVPINCGALPDNLLEAELFGYQRGAFTGADRSKRGLFEVADGGTLFLDEIADTSLAMQSKLLRALQEGEIRPLGAEQLRHVDIRVICASNKSLEDEVASGRFREDLYYRLRVLELRMPPLRERRSDIPALIDHLLASAGSTVQLQPEAIRVLQSYDWPGNVRELENELARASAMCDAKQIAIADLSAPLRERPPLPEMEAIADLTLKPQVEALERRLVEAAMKETENNQSKAAVLLGLSRYGLQKKLQRYGIVGLRT